MVGLLWVNLRPAVDHINSDCASLKSVPALAVAQLHDSPSMTESLCQDFANQRSVM